MPTSSNRADLWSLLANRMGQWIDRDDINFVGGSDASRRMRELKDSVLLSGTHRLEERRDDSGRYEYRLVEIPLEARNHPERQRWECVKCGTRPLDFSQTKASLDPRWRLGRCGVCNNENATYRERREARLA